MSLSHNTKTRMIRNASHAAVIQSQSRLGRKVRNKVYT